MAMTVRYTSFNGQIVSENRGGTLHDYVPDALGSTVALLDSTQTQTDQWTYWPNGESTRIKGSTDTKMLFVGTKGCRQDSATRTLMGHRILDTANSRWMTEDPIGFDAKYASMYPYARNAPTTFSDPAGTFNCAWCLGAWMFAPTLLQWCVNNCDNGRPKPRACTAPAKAPPAKRNFNPGGRCMNAVKPGELCWKYCYFGVDCVNACKHVKTDRDDNELCGDCCEALGRLVPKDKEEWVTQCNTMCKAKGEIPLPFNPPEDPYTWAE